LITAIISEYYVDIIGTVGRLASAVTRGHWNYGDEQRGKLYYTF